MNCRSTFVWAVLGLSAVCAAQVRGIPASVNSPGNNDFFARGIPASVGSLGPLGYGRSIPNPDFVPLSPPRRNRLGRVVMPTPVPLFYGVAYPAVVYVPVPMEDAVGSERRAPEPQKIIVEIRDTRPTPPLVDSRIVDAKIVPAKEVESKPGLREEIEAPRAATVFIFQDGSRKELKDFAITPTELIDLSDGLIRRSPLNALDRTATLKVNAEQGVEVHFPATASD